MKIFSLFVFLIAALFAEAQNLPDSESELEAYFKNWYRESKKQRVRGKKRNKIERDVLTLFVCATNGGTDAAGNPMVLKGVMPPKGRYSLIQRSLSCRVVERFPVIREESGFYDGVGWREVADSLLVYNRKGEIFIEPLGIDPDLFRIRGLSLDEKRDGAIRNFLESDTADRKELVGGVYLENLEQMIKGKRYRLLSKWIELIQPHWGNKWIYRSFPIITGSVIDEGGTQALITYSTHNGGGYGHYKKDGGRWVLTESRITIMH